MMLKAKILVAASVVTCSFSALYATSASAGWFVNGAELKTSAALTTAEVIDQIPVFNVPMLPLKVACKGGTLVGVEPEIIAPSSVSERSVVFRECTVTEPTACSLESPEIRTEPITAQVSLAAGESDKIVYSTTASHIAEFALGGTSCSIAGKKAVTGSVTERAPHGQLESSIETLEGLGSIENNSLDVANDVTYLEGGKALVKLTSGSKWSFK
jgi:hypothetical protein